MIGMCCVECRGVGVVPVVICVVRIGMRSGLLSVGVVMIRCVDEECCVKCCPGGWGLGAAGGRSGRN